MKQKIKNTIYVFGLYFLFNSAEILWIDPLLYQRGGIYNICNSKFHFHQNFIYPPDME